ncbi:hypothetical protein BASA60_010008 [Batrachochytrium salamandrivorans]|nr:hypothetical protein BASA60_010008 [Batrachochytrium salamandrivorans]
MSSVLLLRAPSLWSHALTTSSALSRTAYTRSTISSITAKKRFSSHGVVARRNPVRNAAWLLLGAGATLATIAYISDPLILNKIQRSTLFWRAMFPIYMRYRFQEWRLKDASPEEARQAWDDLHRESAPQVLELLLQLRGIYIKVGQILATRKDIAPKIYRDHFAELLDRVPALSGAEARLIIEKALNAPINSVFAEFDDISIGAASIGQVHKAKLHDGRVVVVKIQYPDAEDLFRQDIITGKQFAEMAQPEQVLAMNELERQILKEFQFDKEAWALETVRKNIMPYYKNIEIPTPIKEFSNKDILVMEYIPGVKLTDAVIADSERIAKRLNTTVDVLQTGKFTTWMGVRHAAYAVLDTTWSATATVYNWTLGWVAPNLSYAQKPIDIKSIFKTLVNVHGKQILIDGVFNGDPHPGNILVMPDGRLGLIDYGQVKTLTKKELGLDRDDEEACEGMSLQQYLEYLNKRDPSKTIPEHLIMAVRACILLRGTASLMGAGSISIAQEWKQLAKRAIRLYPENPATDDDIPVFTCE